MTARSPRGGRLAFDPSQFAGDTPVEAYFVRDAIANALLACADEGSASPFVTWGAKKSSMVVGTPDQFVTAPASLATTFDDSYYPIGTYGPFSLPVFIGDQPYALRVLLFGASKTGDPVDFTVRAGPALGLGAAYGGDASEERSYSGITSTTPAQLTPDGGATNIITLTGGAVRGIAKPYTTLDDTGGDPVSTRVYEVYVRVWGRAVGKGPSYARLYGCHVAPFVGAT